ncbi:hypothetical protein Poly30_49210 [Planctomycetes bacterium Poly30]|uniref:Aminoglycoside phosphotransferase domain-containing protein n=1 Tax=Saltatorellus ferox TaxID=2528018 RepID=A0A518EZ45_9BACT|nr:hypothetical protein Poly30_49210 [Planctomycetes bacterium Poly30]
MTGAGAGAGSAEPGPQLVAFVEETAGPVSRWRDASWDHAESEVWEASLQSGGRVFLKCHRQPGKFAQEREALERWAPAVGECPALLAARGQEPRALLLEAVPGEPLLSAGLTAEEECAHHERAGRWLRRLHALPFEDSDPLAIPEALTKRSETWSSRASGRVEPGLIAEIHARVSAPWPAGAQVPRRVPCHRDFTARNWIASGDSFHVIDFEHARADWALVDVERARSSIPAGREALWSAFLKGYGHAVNHALLDRLELHAALARVVWAVEHEDAEFERSGRSVIAARLERS